MSQIAGDPPRVAKRRRTKDGCRPCRVRKKKCDGRKPTCVSCERNVLLCSWFPSTGNGDKTSKESRDACDVDGHQAASSPSSSSSPARSRSVSKDVGSLFSNCSNLPTFLSGSEVQSMANLHHQPSLQPIIRSPTSVLLYQHWIERTADVVSAKRGQRNAFVTELPRLAIAYPDTVLQSLLAISGIHYINGNKLPDIEMTTWTHLGLALRSLKHGLTKLMSPEGCDPIPLLTTSLVMCFLENTRGDVNGSVPHHIRAAHTLFNSAMACHSLKMDESILEFLKEFYIYITRITDISYDSERPPTATQSGNEQSSVVLWNGAKSHGMLVGCAYEIFDIIPRVSALARRKRGRLRSRDIGQQMTKDQDRELEEDRESYRAMHAYIQAWQPPSPSDGDRDIATCGAIYQQAVLCYLDISFADPALLAGPELPPFVQERFDALNPLLEALPPDANISSTLCWPLALFGSLAKDSTQREIIYNRLQAMWEELKIGNIRSTMRFLEKLWDELRRDETLLMGSSSSSANVAAEGKKKNDPLDLTDMEGLMKRYNQLVSFV